MPRLILIHNHPLDASIIIYGTKRQWPKQSDVGEEGKSFRTVAEMCRIPLATLHDHVTEKVDPFSKPGPKPYLSPNKEDELVAFLLKCTRMEYPKSCEQVTAIVQSIVNSKNMNVEVSTGWWARLKKKAPKPFPENCSPTVYTTAASTRPSCAE